MSAVSVWEEIFQDAKQTFRFLRNNPGFSLVAVILISIGIGASTGIFTVLNAILWRPLPVRSPEQLVRLVCTDRSSNKVTGVPSKLLPEIQTRAGAFSGIIAGIADGLSFHYRSSQAERVIGEAVTANYFAVLGVSPYIGRFFPPDSNRSGWRPDVVLSYHFFVKRFAADRGILGNTILLNGYRFTIVGVTPPGFFGTDVGSDPDLRIPLMFDKRVQAHLMPAMALLSLQNEEFVEPIGRLGPGVDAAQAQARTAVLFKQLLRQLPDNSEYASLKFELKDGSRGTSRFRHHFERPLLILMGVVALLLLITCSNVAALLLARSSVRKRETAVRLAVGATRSRLIRQLLLESLTIAILGAVAGIGVASVISGKLFAFLPQTNVPAILDLSPNRSVLLFAIAASVLTAIAFGLAPALQSTKVDLSSCLKSERSGAGPSGSRGLTLHRMIIVAQLALSLVVLNAAGLFVESVHNLKEVPLGFEVRNLLLFTLKPVQDGNVKYSQEQLHRFFQSLPSQLQSVPGVVEASVASGSDFLNGRSHSTVLQTDDGRKVSVQLVFQAIGPSHLDCLRVPMLAGRGFTRSDRMGAPGVVIVSQSLAEALFGHTNPIGRKITTSKYPGDQNLRIVGVIPDVHYSDVRTAHPEILLRPFAQNFVPDIPLLVVRINNNDAIGMTKRVKHRLHELDPEIPVFDVRTGTAQLNQSIAQYRVVSWISSCFGLVALCLAAIGLYGLVSYSVMQKTKEIGIRMAIGADCSTVRNQILWDTLRLLGAGLVLGVPLLVISEHFISALLFHVSGYDSSVPLVVCLLLAMVAILATIIPATRASRVDPAKALRCE